MSRLRGLPLLLALGACGPGHFVRVIEPADIYDLVEGVPRISRVRDLGNLHIGQAGVFEARSDGRLTIGELIEIQGSGLGRQPSVRIGARPAEILWRTRGGGAILRVPTGLAAGPQALIVENGAGSAEAQVLVRRLALVLDRRLGQLHAVEVGGGRGAPPAVRLALPRPIELPGAALLAISSDGGAGYVARSGPGGERVAVIDLGAAGGPRLVEERPIGHRVVALLGAARAPVMALVGERAITIWDVRRSSRPAAWPEAPLPDEAQHGRSYAIDADGRLLAVASAQSNQVALLALRTERGRATATLIAKVDALPAVRQPVLRQLRYDGAGTLFALSGDGADHAILGHQPTRLSTIQILSKEDDGPGEKGPALKGTVELPDAGAPLYLSIGRTQADASGATIREGGARSLAYFTALSLAGAGRSEGALLRADGLGTLSEIHRGAEILTGLDLTPDATIAVATSCSVSPQGFAVLLAHAEAGSTVTLPLAPSPGRCDPGSAAGEIAVQP